MPVTLVMMSIRLGATPIWYSTSGSAKSFGLIFASGALNRWSARHVRAAFSDVGRT